MDSNLVVKLKLKAEIELGSSMDTRTPEEAVVARVAARPSRVTGGGFAKAAARAV